MTSDRKQDEIKHSKDRRDILDQKFNYLDENTKNDIVSYNVYNNKNYDKNIENKKEFNYHYSNLKFYSLTEKSTKYKINWLKRKCNENKNILDFACGNGENAFLSAQLGSNAVGIDISPDAIEYANKKKFDLKLESKCNFQVMDGENLTFEDNYFDLAIEYGALHHVELNPTLSELSRVLKKDGEMLCIETLRHNPFINWYRKKTPQMRTDFEVEHILGIESIEDFKRYFENVDVKFFHLTTIISLLFRKTFIFKPVFKIFDMVDDLLLKKPFVGKYAWIMIVHLKNPKK